MGIGGALMWPAILGMTFAILPEEKAGLAGGIILGAAGLGNAIGPLIGGVLTDLASLALDLLPQRADRRSSPCSSPTSWSTSRSRRAATDRIDYPGIAALSVGLVSLLIALDQVADWGWGDPRVIGLLALAAVLIVAFVPIERRADLHALVPREVMRNRSFTASCVAILFMSATFFAALLYLPQFMQKQLGYSPLEAGVGMLPFLATFALVSFVAGPLYDRVGAKRLAVLGAACITLGAVPLLAGRRRLRLRLAGRRDGRARDRDRQLLPDRDDRRGDLGRQLADQPRRRDHLHVPDRRRLDRAGADDDRLLLGAAALRRRHPGCLPARRRRSRWSAW